MGLLSPTPGEVFDRLSILSLKIKAAKEKSLECEHFTSEVNQLKLYLNSKYYMKLIGSELAIESQDLLEPIQEIAEVNKKLWTLEDARRKMFKESQKDFLGIVGNAETTTFLNDQRAKLICIINEAYGDHRQEKIY